MERTLVTGFTIDGPTSRDLDDAVWAEEWDGGYTVTVSVADVAAVLAAGSPVDEAARQKGFTRYWAARNDPMLPRKMAEEGCSLLPNTQRHTLTTRITLTETLDVVDVEVFPSTLRSIARLTHADADAFMQGRRGALRDQVTLLGAIATGLLEKRRRAGALAVYDVKHGWVLDEEGRFQLLEKGARNRGYVLVQEMMILANRCMARWLVEKGQPAPFRVHQVQDGVAVEEFLAGVQSLIGTGDLDIIYDFQSKWGSSLQAARYAPTVAGHFGLALDAYLHGTSPIRRYADVVVQRAIYSALGAGPPLHVSDVEDACQLINATEKEWREKRSEDFKMKANSKARKANDPRFVTGLSERDFLRVLEIACREHSITEHLAAAFVTRLQGGQLQPRDFHPLFFQIERGGQPEAQRPFLQTMLDAVWEKMNAEPHHATSVLLMGVQSGHIAALEVEEEGSVSPFRCQVRSGGERGPWRVAGTKKAAKAEAHYALLRHLAGAPVRGDDSAPSSAPPADPVRPNDALNALAWLNEYAQQNQAPYPVYEVVTTSGGFEAACRFGEHETTGTGGSKKAARMAAAAEMVRLFT